MMLFILLLLQLQSSLWLTVSSSSSSSSAAAAAAAAASAIAKPNCKDHCGKVKIPYPFGIGANCFHDALYEIVCNGSPDEPKPFLQHYNFEVMDITWPDLGEGQQKLITVRTLPKNICESNGTSVQSLDLRGSPYRYSRWSNVFMVEGCSGSVVMKNQSGQILTGCASVCPSAANYMNASNCYGEGCCLSSLMSSPTSDYMNREEGIGFYEIFIDHATPTNSNDTCTLAAALIGSESVENIKGNLSYLRSFPTVLEWHATYVTTTIVYDNFSCYNDELGVESCSCNFPYHGLNPYLPNGCQVMPGCQNCRNNCAYNGTMPYCEKKLWLKRPAVLGFSIGIGLVILVLGCYWLYRLIKWRKEIKRKAKYFKRNGGLLLHQQMSSHEGVVEKMTVFTVTELENATDNFHDSRVLGQGGQGTVYKGMLMDGRIVAIKKSKKVDEGQLDQFINEVVILSQVNHRNVVKVLGCCLETEVPLLVYEFISNGTLYQHIHDPTEDFHVTWKMRLQIAAESAGALAYLHSSSSAPIFHRDIKSSNILLDEKFRAKVSDFGTAKAISIEQTHITTCVQGTYGYLDPEYFQSNQFTDKSDVYSFGVVLVELVTGKKPIFPMESGGYKSLAVEFLYQMEHSCLFDIVDPRVIEEGKDKEFIAVADIARQCLNVNGKQRPTMKEVAMILDQIRLPNSKDGNSFNAKCVVTEMDESGPPSSGMFFSDSGSFSSLSIEVQPLIANTH